MEGLGRILTAFLEFLKMYVLYDYGKTKKANQQLKKNEELRDEYEKIDNSNVSIDDALDEWVRKNT